MTSAIDAAADPGSGEAVSSFEDRYRDLWPATVRLARLVTGSQQAGEDVAQEAFIGLLRARQPVTSASAYLRRSVINLTINASRRVQRERDYIARQREPMVVPPDVDEMWHHLRRLPARQRAVLALRYYEDLSEAEIAQVLGCRPGTVKSTAARALDQLRKDLS